MKVRTCPELRRRAIRSVTRLLAVVVVAASAALAVACGSDPVKVDDSGARVDTSTFAGKWVGTLTGPPGGFGNSGITYFLNADSTMSGEADNPLYCTATGTWTVSDTRYTSTARDCTGTIITSIAPKNKCDSRERGARPAGKPGRSRLRSNKRTRTAAGWFQVNVKLRRSASSSEA
jgi:hypothetical protein